MTRRASILHRLPVRNRFLCLAIVASCCVTSPVRATWSIVAADTETQEVGVGSATCVTGFDLKAFLPVVVVGRGAGAAQSLVDGSGQRRQIMFDGFEAGTASSDIVTQLQALSQAQLHQHGLADNGGDSATATGAQNGAHASGVTGTVGTLHYAIQGNVLAGSPVVTEAESAFVNTAGDLPERLMAAMEAARALGGDGRCSCSAANPTACGSPPASFTKAADIGFMIVARVGDTDDPSCTAGGCADGDYFLDFNVPNQTAGDPDPVLTLRTAFDAWRADLVGEPDAVASMLTVVSDTGGFRLRIVPKDWQGTALGAGTLTNVTVIHAPGSAQVNTIGTVVANADGSYDVPLSPTQAAGTDVFAITLDSGTAQVQLPPRRSTLSIVLADGFESGDTSGWSMSVP